MDLPEEQEGHSSLANGHDGPAEPPGVLTKAGRGEETSEEASQVSGDVTETKSGWNRKGADGVDHVGNPEGPVGGSSNTHHQLAQEEEAKGSNLGGAENSCLF